MAAPVIEELTALIENYVRGEQNSQVHDISKGIQDKKFNILQLIECMGSSLSSQDVQLRARGTQLLVETLQQLPTTLLNHNEVEVFIQFLHDRLKDHHSITPFVLKGIHALTQSPVCTDDQITLCLRAIFQEVHLQSMSQSDRRHMYFMTEYLVQNRLGSLQKMGADFVFGFIQAMDGEKDPRNLVIAFTCVKMIAQKLPLGTFAEDLFEVVACYFPIDFNPPPNDPHGITKDQLVLGLRAALAASPLFAEFCLPVLLEKLSSSIGSAKVDSLLTVAACADIYIDKLMEYSGSLWSSIRREVFAAHSESLEQAALRALTAITKAVSTQITEKDKSPALYSFLVEDVFSDVKRHLCEPEQRLVEPSGKILRAAGSASSPACDLILQNVLPLLVEQVNQHKQVSNRRVLVTELNRFLQTAATDLTGEKDDNPLKAYKSDLYGLYLSLLVHSSVPLCHLGVQGIMGLVNLPSMLCCEEIDVCSQHFVRIALEGNKDIRDDVIAGLGNMCYNLTPEGISCLSERLTSLVHTGTDHTDAVDVESELKVLEVISGCCTCLGMVKIAVPFILGRLHASQQKSAHCPEKPVFRAMCCHLQSVISRNLTNGSIVDYIQAEVLLRIIGLCLEGVACDTSVLSEWDVVSELSNSVRHTVCVLKSRDAVQLVQDVVTLFLDGQSPGFGPISFSPFNPESPRTQTQLVCVLSAVVCSVQRDVTIPRLCDILTKLLHITIRCQHLETCQTSARCLAGLINKMADGEALSVSLGSIDTAMKQVLEHEASSPHPLQRAVDVIVWISKALLLRSHPLQKYWINLLLSKLNDPVLGVMAAEGFATILVDGDTVLRQEMHAIIMFMYKQRLFVMTSNCLIEGFHSVSSEQQVAYLIAISHLLKYVPRDAISSHLPQLLPLLVQCLEYDNVSLWLGTLTTLTLIVMEMPDLVAKYTDELIRHCLRLAKYKPKMNVRISSLQCLQYLCSLPETLLLPHKHHVTQQLASVLDDHKRLVRKEAVLTRTQWFLIGAPGT